VRESLRSACPDGEIASSATEGTGSTATRSYAISAARREAARRREPASFVAWDLLALDEEDFDKPQPNAARSGEALANANRRSPTPATKDRALAADWFYAFEAAARLRDGKAARRRLSSGKAAMLKIKHAREDDGVVRGIPLATEWSRTMMAPAPRL